LKERSATQSCFINELRENWPNPPQWLDRIPADPHAAAFKQRTLTHLYDHHFSLKPDVVGFSQG
jgi:hypothetical protein